MAAAAPSSTWHGVQKGKKLNYWYISLCFTIFIIFIFSYLFFYVFFCFPFFFQFSYMCLCIYICVCFKGVKRAEMSNAIDVFVNGTVGQVSVLSCG